MSKRARREASKAMPPIGMRFCVGDRAVPLEAKEVMNSEGQMVTLDFVHLTSRNADLDWLRRALGKHCSWHFTADHSPLAADIRGALNWKRSAGFARVLHNRPLPKNCAPTITVRGTSIQVWAPRKESLWLAATEDNLACLRREILNDADAQPIGGVEAIDDPHAEQAGHLGAREVIDNAQQAGLLSENVHIDDPHAEQAGHLSNMDVIDDGSEAGPLGGMEAPILEDRPFAPLDLDVNSPSTRRFKRWGGYARPYIQEPDSASEGEAPQTAPRSSSSAAGTPRRGAPAAETCEETSLREQCLARIVAALPPLGGKTRVAWQPSRNSFLVHLDGTRQEFLVRNLNKKRMRGCVEEAYCEAAQRAVQWLQPAGSSAAPA